MTAHTLREARNEYDRLDRLLGVDTSGIELAVSPHRGKRLGSFRSPNPRTSSRIAVPPRILLSAAVLENDELFWDTIRHEYAHAVVWLTHPDERHGHDAIWKDVCRQIGCTPRATTAASEEQKREWMNTAKYRVHCESCGADTYYQRAGKVVSILMRGEKRRLRCPCGSCDLSLYIRREKRNGQ